MIAFWAFEPDAVIREMFFISAATYRLRQGIGLSLQEFAVPCCSGHFWYHLL